MTPDVLRAGRLGAGMTQAQAAVRLGLSQPYLSLLESGRRGLTPKVARSAAKLYRLPPTALPVPRELPKTLSHGDRLARQLAGLGYPEYRHLHPAHRLNPALLLLGALSEESLDARVIEALPWVLVHYPDLDWEWLLSQTKLRNLQNKLGFLVEVGRGLAETQARWSDAALRLAEVEQELEKARLVAETTLGRKSMPLAEREWLRANRPPQARHWNVLANLRPERLPYAE